MIYAKWIKNIDPFAPDTGSYSHISLWFTLLFISGGALWTVYSRKK